MNNKGADQTVWMHRLICTFVVRIWQIKFSHDVAHMKLEAASNEQPYLWPYWVAAHAHMKDLKSNDTKDPFLMRQPKRSYMSLCFSDILTQTSWSHAMLPRIPTQISWNYRETIYILITAMLPRIPTQISWNYRVGWLCWGLTSQSTIFQSCRDGAIASWVINQYFRGVKCLAQGHNTAVVGFEPRTSRSGVRHSTTEPPRSPKLQSKNI